MSKSAHGSTSKKPPTTVASYQHSLSISELRQTHLPLLSPNTQQATDDHLWLRFDMQMAHVGSPDSAEKLRRDIERVLQTRLHNNFITLILMSAEPTR